MPRIRIVTRGDDSGSCHSANRAIADAFRERGYIDSCEALSLLEQHRQGTIQAHRALWRMVCFEVWMRVFFDQGQPILSP